MYRISKSEHGKTAPFMWTAFVLLATMLVTAPSQAQNGNQSNGTSTIVTTSDAVGGAFAQIRPYGIEADFASPLVQARINEVAQGLNRQLASGSLLIVPIASVEGGIVTAVAAQRNLLCLSTEATSPASETCLDDVRRSLDPGGSEPAATQTLLESLRGLTAHGEVDAERFAASLEAYDHFVRNASSDFFDQPSDEFAVIHLILSSLAEAASPDTR